MSAPVPGEALIREYVLACRAHDLGRVARARYALFEHLAQLEIELAEGIRDPQPAMIAARQLLVAVATWYEIAGIKVRPPTPPSPAPSKI